MLLAVERHPAMLLYLDNHLSVGPHSKAARLPNRRQNGRRIVSMRTFARETLSCIRLGGRRYTQTDVTTFAERHYWVSIGGDVGAISTWRVRGVPVSRGAPRAGAKVVLGSDT